MVRRPPRSTLFPYTTSSDLREREAVVGGAESAARVVGGAEQVGVMEAEARVAGGDGPAAPGDRLGVDVEALVARSEEHTSELQSLRHLVCRLLLEKKKQRYSVSPIKLGGRRYQYQATATRPSSLQQR